MGRVKEIQDKQAAPKLNVDASKRFVRNALWNAAQKGTPVNAAAVEAAKQSIRNALWNSTPTGATPQSAVKRMNYLFKCGMCYLFVLVYIF